MKKKPQTNNTPCLPKNSGVFMRTETELELFPYLHSKFLGSEYITFGQKSLP